MKKVIISSMRFRLSTLLIALAAVPPVIAWLALRPSFVPVLVPIHSGSAPLGIPSDDDVIRAWLRTNEGKSTTPVRQEWQSKTVRITKHRLGGYVDPARMLPLIGKAELWHAHFKCTIDCQRADRSGVIYIDLNGFRIADR